MLFNSLEFLIFLPLVFIGYWLIFKRTSIQNLFVFAASYLFYGWWDYRFLFLIFLTTVTCFAAGIMIDRSKTYKAARWTCGINIALNVAILCYFKYFNFFSENLRILFEQFGYQLDWFTLDVLLPVGISFYTFQAISYPIDVYRKKIAASKDFIAFGAFISFFPQLVAGPIERSTNLLPQFETPRSFDYGEALDGMRQMLWGFFKKIVIADNCANFANRVFNHYETCDTFTLWLGAIFFSFQIYGDFSGYSDIAIGTAKLFGIRLKRNFHFPYFSRDIAEFWRRWHISLNTWFRDYIYIPLGGSRCSKIKIIRNTMIVFMLSGLWHGADWTFVVWGTFHGLLFLPLILAGSNRKHLDNVSEKFLPSLKSILQMSVTFILVMTGWIIFRAVDIEQAASYIAKCYTGNPGFTWDTSPLRGDTIMVCVTLMFIVIFQGIDWTQRTKSYGLQIVEGRNIAFRWCSYAILILLIVLFAANQQQFIYFQF